MRHFAYESILTDITETQLSGNDIFKKYYEEDCKWLHEHDIQYQVDVFRWPQLPFFTQFNVSKVRTEVTVIIDNIEHAVMFRLYSGLSGE